MKKILILLMMSMLLLACGDKGKDTLNTLNGSLVCYGGIRSCCRANI